MKLVMVEMKSVMVEMKNIGMVEMRRFHLDFSVLISEMSGFAHFYSITAHIIITINGAEVDAL